MYQYDSKSGKRGRRGGQSRKIRRKKRIQLFLNLFMLVCTGIVVCCIGALNNRESAVHNDFGGFVRKIESVIDRPRGISGGTEHTGMTSGGYDSGAELSGNEAERFVSEREKHAQGTDSLHDAPADSGQESDDPASGWELTLVNKWNPLPEDAEMEVVELSNGERVDRRIYPYLQQMFDDARAEEIYPIVRSGYRTRQEQIEIYEERMQRYQADGLSAEAARAETELWVAVPGTSEHELGLAVDINADRIHSEGAEVYAWLQEHAHLYGFINRYPSDKTEITGVANEPWHYRYVGTEAAAAIYEQGVCLEEYLGELYADDATLMHR